METIISNWLMSPEDSCHAAFVLYSGIITRDAGKTEAAKGLRDHFLDNIPEDTGPYHDLLREVLVARVEWMEVANMIWDQLPERHECGELAFLGQDGNMLCFLCHQGRCPDCLGDIGADAMRCDECGWERKK